MGGRLLEAAMMCSWRSFEQTDFPDLLLDHGQPMHLFIVYMLLYVRSGHDRHRANIPCRPIEPSGRVLAALHT